MRMRRKVSGCSFKVNKQFEYIVLPVASARDSTNVRHTPDIHAVVGPLSTNSNIRRLQAIYELWKDDSSRL